MKALSLLLVLLMSGAWSSATSAYSYQNSEDADMAAVVKDVLATQISRRRSKLDRPLNVSRGVIDASLIPAKIGNVEIVLVDRLKIEKQEEFSYVEFENFRVRRAGIEVVLGIVWQTCSSGGHDRDSYTYSKVEGKWKGEAGERFIDIWDGSGRCTKK